MDLFVVYKKPGTRAELLPAPERVDLAFLKPLVTGYIELFPTAQLVSETLRGVTLIVNEEGALRGLEPNLRFETGGGVLGPLVAVLTNEEGDDHGLCLEHAEAVARALDHYGVGLTVGAN